MSIKFSQPLSRTATFSGDPYSLSVDAGSPLGLYVLWSNEGGAIGEGRVGQVIPVRPIPLNRLQGRGGDREYGEPLSFGRISGRGLPQGTAFLKATETGWIEAAPCLLPKISREQLILQEVRCEDRTLLRIYNIGKCPVLVNGAPLKPGRAQQDGVDLGPGDLVEITDQLLLICWLFDEEQVVLSPCPTEGWDGDTSHSDVSAAMVGQSRAMREFRERLGVIMEAGPSHLIFSCEGSIPGEPIARMLHQCWGVAGPLVPFVADSVARKDHGSELLCGGPTEGRKSLGALERAKGGLLYIEGIDRLDPQVRDQLFELAAGGNAANLPVIVATIRGEVIPWESTSGARFEKLISLPPLANRLPDTSLILKRLVEVIQEEWRTHKEGHDSISLECRTLSPALITAVVQKVRWDNGEGCPMSFAQLNSLLLTSVLEALAEDEEGLPLKPCRAISSFVGNRLGDFERSSLASMLPADGLSLAILEGQRKAATILGANEVTSTEAFVDTLRANYDPFLHSLNDVKMEVGWEGLFAEMSLASEEGDRAPDKKARLHEMRCGIVLGTELTRRQQAWYAELMPKTEACWLLYLLPHRAPMTAPCPDDGWGLITEGLIEAADKLFLGGRHASTLASPRPISGEVLRDWMEYQRSVVASSGKALISKVEQMRTRLKLVAASVEGIHRVGQFRQIYNKLSASNLKVSDALNLHCQPYGGPSVEHLPRQVLRRSREMVTELWGRTGSKSVQAGLNSLIDCGVSRPTERVTLDHQARLLRHWVVNRAIKSFRKGFSIRWEAVESLLYTRTLSDLGPVVDLTAELPFGLGQSPNHMVSYSAVLYCWLYGLDSKLGCFFDASRIPPTSSNDNLTPWLYQLVAKLHLGAYLAGLDGRGEVLEADLDRVQRYIEEDRAEAGLGNEGAS